MNLSELFGREAAREPYREDLADDRPVTMQYHRNTTPAPRQVNHYHGQDIEPHGQYFTQGPMYSEIPGYETGEKSFQRPLRLFSPTDDPSHQDHWKQQLQRRYNATGKALSQAIRDDGYDAILTHDEYGPSESVDLTSFIPRRAAEDPGVYRGLSIVLPPHIHKMVHDPSQPAASRAHLLLSEVKKQKETHDNAEGGEGPAGGLGSFWTPQQHKAVEFANQSGFGAYKEHELKHNCGDPDYGDGGCPTTRVIVHATTPPEKHHWKEIFRPGEEYHPDISWRLPVRPGAPMRVRGISWNEGNDHLSSEEKYSAEGMRADQAKPYENYDFMSEVRKRAAVSFPNGGDPRSYTQTMWDHWHPMVNPEIHRHLGVPFPSGHPAHDDKLPMEERAKAIVEHVSRGPYGGGIGMHWTDDPIYNHLSGARSVPGETPVILHAQKPAREHVEDDEDTLMNRAVRDWDTEEREVPLKHKAPVDITGVSWGTTRGMVRHNFGQPIRREAAHTPPGTMGTDSEGHQVQMTTMDGWAHADGSHGHEDNTTIGDKPVYTQDHTWLPSGRYWGPNSAQNDQRLFEGDHLRPEVRKDILDRVGSYMMPRYKNWRRWTKVYFAGSEAAKWQPFNGDFDVLIGIDFDRFRQENPDFDDQPDDAVAKTMTDGMWHTINVDGYWFELADGRKVGPFDRTFFVNPNAWDIRKLKPYAAYDVTDDTWAVHPLEVPKDWDATHLPESYWTYAEALLNEVRAIEKLPPEEKHRMAANLWETLHTHRSDAFTGDGKGLFDLSNIVEKYLDQHPEKPWDKLRQWKNSSPSGAEPWVPTTGRTAKIMPGADSDGIMIAIIPPEKVGKKLVIEDGEPLEALHVTLCYLGSKGEHSKDQVESLESLVRAWARTQKPFKAKVGGVGTFVNPGQHVLWGAVDIPGGGEMRQGLSDLLEDHKYKVRNDHGWTPHITLKYDTSHFRFMPKVKPMTWDVTEIMLCIGGKWTPIPLGS